jgi:hypothetical protein
MKRTAAKLVSILLIAVMCFSMFPAEAYAWGKMTHTYTANLIHDDLTKTGAGTSSLKYAGESDFNFAIPQEFLEAIREYPDMFRAGALGPDMYPDILTGQMYIHPEDENVDSGEWVKYLCDSVNKMGKNTAGRKSSLAFTLGCIFHYCGDLFGHDFINTFSGGAFPSVASIEMLDITSERLNNVMSHLAAEKYMDELLYPDYDVNKNGKIDAPTKFVSNIMVFNGTPAAGLAPLYQKYPAIQIPFDEIDSNFVKNMLDDFFDEDGNNVPPHYTAMNALRAYVTSQADKYREHMEPVSAIITRYCDEWAADVDRGTIAFTTACDNIARRMVTKEKNPLIEEKKEEEEKSEYNSIVLFTYEQMKEMAKQQGVTDAQLKAVEEASKLGVDGHSFMDEVIRELVLKGVITPEMLNQEDSSITIIKEELGYWWDEYGVYMLGIPDIIIDGIEIPLIGDIVDLLLLGPLWDLIKYEIKKVAAEWVASACIGMISDVTGLSGAEAAEAISTLVSKMNDRLEDPELQLDHEDNPYKPSENNFEEFQKYMEHLKNAQNLNQMQDTDFEALYNTIAMFKLVLMGPDVYKMFVENRSGVQPTAYQKNIAHVEASALKLQIRTSNLYWAGTDDNIYVIKPHIW